MFRISTDGVLPRRVPGAARVRYVICPAARDLVQVDEPTSDLLLRVRDALRAWASTDPAAG